MTSVALLKLFRMLKVEIRKLNPEISRQELNKCFDKFTKSKWGFMKYTELCIWPHRRFFYELTTSYAGEDLVPVPQFLPCGINLKPCYREDLERTAFLVLEILDLFEECYL